MGFDMQSRRMMTPVKKKHKTPYESKTDLGSVTPIPGNLKRHITRFSINSEHQTNVKVPLSPAKFFTDDDGDLYCYTPWELRTIVNRLYQKEDKSPLDYMMARFV
jgi:hypothetical protein